MTVMVLLGHRLQSTKANFAKCVKWRLLLVFPRYVWFVFE
jgi:hypothetical protein